MRHICRPPPVPEFRPADRHPVSCRHPDGGGRPDGGGQATGSIALRPWSSARACRQGPWPCTAGRPVFAGCPTPSAAVMARFPPCRGLMQGPWSRPSQARLFARMVIAAAMRAARGACQVGVVFRQSSPSSSAGFCRHAALPRKIIEPAQRYATLPACHIAEPWLILAMTHIRR